MVRGHDQPCGSTPAQPAVGPHPAPAAAATAAPPRRRPGHVPDRNCVAALLFMARTGVFEQLQAVLLDELGEAGRLDLERVLVDSASVRAVKGR